MLKIKFFRKEKLISLKIKYKQKIESLSFLMTQTFILLILIKDKKFMNNNRN